MPLIVPSMTIRRGPGGMPSWESGRLHCRLGNDDAVNSTFASGFFKHETFLPNESQNHCNQREEKLYHSGISFSRVDDQGKGHEIDQEVSPIEGAMQKILRKRGILYPEDPVTQHEER